MNLALNIKTISYDARVKIFWSMVLVSMMSLAMYFYGIMATVHHTVTRQALQTKVSELTTHVSELEFKAIALKNDVNLSLAYERGFKEVTNPLYISRSASRSLSFNTRAR